MSLSDLVVRQSKAQSKPYILQDDGGLSLFVAANGVKSWHFRYRLNGKQDRYSLGCYPTISLKQARFLRDEAHGLLAQGIDPLAARRKKKNDYIVAQANTFKVTYDKWFAHRCLTLKEGRQTTRCTIQRVFNNDVLPFIGKRPISEIERFLFKCLGNGRSHLMRFLPCTILFHTSKLKSRYLSSVFR